MEDSKVKFCPMLSTGTEALVQCLDAGCAWYENRKCAIIELPSAIRAAGMDVKDALDDIYTQI